MSYDYNKKLVGNARYMRKNMTDEEKQLWYIISSPLAGNRQKTNAIKLENDLKSRGVTCYSY